MENGPDSGAKARAAKTFHRVDSGHAWTAWSDGFFIYIGKSRAMKELRFVLKPCRDTALRGTRTTQQEQQAIDELVAQLERFDRCTGACWSAHRTSFTADLVVTTDKTRDEIAVWLEPFVKAYGLTA